MSNVMRPAGPLPPRVYWTRRILLIVVVVLLISFVWWLVGGSGRAEETKAGPDAGSTTTSPTQPAHTTGVHRHKQSPGPAQQPTKKPGKQAKNTKHAQPTRQPLAQPTGPCDPADVDIKIDVPDAVSGEPDTASFLLTSTKTPACTLAITPNEMVVRVTSGAEVIWSSDDCPDALRAQEVVARADPPAAYEFRWNGRRSSENCQPVSTLPSPGGYWVEAALIGGDPHKAYFDIKAPKS